MPKKEIRDPVKEKTTGAYSAAVEADGGVFVSGQGPFDPKTAQVIRGTVEEATQVTLAAVEETEYPRAEEVDVRIARATVVRIFEMMVLEVLDGIAHVRFAGGERLTPNGLSRSLNFYCALRTIETSANHNLRTRGASAQL